MLRNSGAILWISESVFLYAVSLDSEMAVFCHGGSTDAPEGGLGLQGDLFRIL